MFFHDPNNSLRYARIEEERCFLLKLLPPDLVESDPFIHIIDRYIEGTRLRLRRMESPHGNPMSLKLGQKYQSEEIEAQQSIMTNMYLNEAEHRVLSALGGAQINKRRYSYDLEQKHYSIDVFEGALAGLILAEIEGRPDVDLTLLAVPDFAFKR